MANVAWADSVAFARSAALICAAATLLSTWRRTLPQKSGTQEALPSIEYSVLMEPPPRPPTTAPLDVAPPPPPPDLVRVTLEVTLAVGNSPAWVSRTSATAAR